MGLKEYYKRKEKERQEEERNRPTLEAFLQKECTTSLNNAKKLAKDFESLATLLSTKDLTFEIDILASSLDDNEKGHYVISPIKPTSIGDALKRAITDANATFSKNYGSIPRYFSVFAVSGTAKIEIDDDYYLDYVSEDYGEPEIEDDGVIDGHHGPA